MSFNYLLASFSFSLPISDINRFPPNDARNFKPLIAAGCRKNANSPFAELRVSDIDHKFEFGPLLYHTHDIEKVSEVIVLQYK